MISSHFITLIRCVRIKIFFDHLISHFTTVYHHILDGIFYRKKLSLNPHKNHILKLLSDDIYS